MRDADRYCHPGEHVWTAADSDVVDCMLELIKKEKKEPHVETLQSLVTTRYPERSPTDVARIWERMHTFPYIFELAVLTQTLDTLTLQGSTQLDSSTPSVPQLTSKIHFQNWHVSVKDFTEFRLRDKLTPALFEHFAQIFRIHAPPYLVLAKQTHAKKAKFQLHTPILQFQSHVFSLLSVL